MFSVIRTELRLQIDLQKPGLFGLSVAWAEENGNIKSDEEGNVQSDGLARR